jgi:cytoskeleton protein RodZ
MDELGQKLRRAREERGVPLREIASRTKISLAALEALERSEFKRLPGGIFSRALVRAYATEVGLDPDTTVENFLASARRSERESAERVAATRAYVTRDDREFLERQRRAFHKLRLAVIVAAAGAVALLVWQMRPFWRGEAAPAEMARHAASASPLPPPLPAPPPAPEPPPSTELPAIAEPRAPATLDAGATAGSDPTVAPAASMRATPPTPAPATAETSSSRGSAAPAAAIRTPAEDATPTPAGPDESGPPAEARPSGPVEAPRESATTPLVIELIGVSDSEVRIVRDGGMVDRRILRAGQRQRLTVAREIDLTVGDAGAVRWLINGRPAAPLGQAGASARVLVTPGNAGEFVRDRSTSGVN